MLSLSLRGILYSESWVLRDCMRRPKIPYSPGYFGATISHLYGNYIRLNSSSWNSICVTKMAEQLKCVRWSVTVHRLFKGDTYSVPGKYVLKDGEVNLHYRVLQNPKVMRTPRFVHGKVLLQY